MWRLIKRRKFKLRFNSKAMVTIPEMSDEENVLIERLGKVYVPNEDSLEKRMVLHLGKTVSTILVRTGLSSTAANFVFPFSSSFDNE